MRRVAIIDYGLCNLDSVCRAVELCNGLPLVATEPSQVLTTDMMVLPGVGAFGAAMRNLKSRHLDEALREQVGRGVPLLGICLGMQLLASSSTEDGRHEGLGFVPGEVVLLNGSALGERVPHIGWNNVVVHADDPLFKGIPSETNFYFVHSYYFQPTNADWSVASTPYCGEFTSVVRRDNVVGTQFHPEKSQRAGFALLKNFLIQ